MARQYQSIWLRSLTAGAALGFIVGGLMMYVAWQHNAQGEIRSEAGVDWVYWFGIGLSWFLPVLLVSTAIIGSTWTIADRRERSRT